MYIFSMVLKLSKYPEDLTNNIISAKCNSICKLQIYV